MLIVEESVAIVSIRLRGLLYGQVRQEFMRKFRKPIPQEQISGL